MFNYQGMLSFGFILKVYRNNKCFLILFWNKLKLKTWSAETWVYLRPRYSKFYNLESKWQERGSTSIWKGKLLYNWHSFIMIFILHSELRQRFQFHTNSPVFMNHNPSRFVPHSEQNLDVSRMYGMPHSSQNFGGPAGCCLDIVKCQ